MTRQSDRATDTAATPGPDSLIAAAKQAQKAGKLPPVDQWNPPFCGDLDMEIKRDGTWFYEGTPIGRKPLVRLFSTILKREGDAYFLVTPVEKVGIRVEDAPFVAVDFETAGAGRAQVITFTTNVGDTVIAGPDHAIRVLRGGDGEPSPYVHIRAGLEALIDRKSFYRLVDVGEAHRVDGTDWFGVWSQGTFFRIIPIAELDL
ncbi:Proteophosphoglycan precursor [Roseibacterium elongatum DSM 19469]|uniref:Proteophosphoglycan n=1 Tax=Roseicyclus elongatus DSM 19469 TaxID=1294273 RepID=W8S1G7_9RHOB|nr:Proteophosphoglycan precursor [Roseibacterium elongatum DSM 19469]